MGVAMCTDCLDICLSLNHAFELPVCLQQIPYTQGVRCLYTCFVVEDDCLSQTPLCTIGHFTNTLLSHNCSTNQTLYVHIEIDCLKTLAIVIVDTCRWAS